jgi:triosephosphate isomerase
MSERTPLIAGNWKMYKTVSEAVDTARSLVSLVKDVQGVQVMIAPPFTSLAPVAQVLEGSRVRLGAQNLHWEAEGAFTGEISAGMLRSAGCDFVIIGHSERRQYFGETDGTVNRRIAAALDSELIPVLCVGETEQEREADQTFSVLDKQIRKGLEGFSSGSLGTLVVAYEPVWAIGTGKTATKEQAQEAHAYIRSRVEELLGANLAKALRILYGGSVKPDNVSGLMGMSDLDGALVGGASLDAETFSRIVHFNG